MLGVSKAPKSMNIAPAQSTAHFSSLERDLNWLQHAIIEGLSVSGKDANSLLKIYIKFLLAIKSHNRIYFAVPTVIDKVIHIHALKTKIFQKFFDEKFNGKVIHQSEVFGSDVYWSSANLSKEIVEEDKEHYTRLTRKLAPDSEKLDLFSSCLIMMDVYSSQKASEAYFFDKNIIHLG